MEKGFKVQARRVILQQVAPAYHDASGTQKKHLLKEFITATGYTHKYARWLLNHAEEVFTPPTALRRRYGPEVEEALVLAWKTLNRICTKRLIPFLPDMLETLEEEGHVQLSKGHRSLLLSMSAATADRLLQAHRYTHPYGLSTTKAGPLLKQQIPIRTFAQWEEAKPGFLEVDLVAHCGGRLQGGCLYTMTLTDVATGWTECLPLLNRGREAVVAALQRARRRFPFPILGLDTDNGGEFLNEEVAAYCVRERITFTRGRPYEKRDQCFVEQKNGVVVRQVVGYGRLMGVHPYQQLDELYRALHWYINGFQPSMKLVAKRIEGRTIHRIYDTARTPLQRVLLSNVLPSSQQQELRAAVRALDPLRLFQQVEQMQQALFCDEARTSLADQPPPGLRLFDLAGCAASVLLLEENNGDALPPEEQKNTGTLGWRRTSKDPFAGQWEQILAWVQANPTRSCGDILRELQSLFPGRYKDSHLRTLQRGMRKIRTHVLQGLREGDFLEACQGNQLSSANTKPVEPVPESLGAPSLGVGEKRLSPDGSQRGPSDQPQAAGQSSLHVSRKTPDDVLLPSKHAPDQVIRRSHPAPSRSVRCSSSRKKGQRLTIERAILQYLQAHRMVGHRPKTLEWHQTVLSHLHQYLQIECDLVLVHQLTETALRNWLEWLAQTPTTKGAPRSASTIETYARSARAFCGWLVEQGVLSCSPLSERLFPRTSAPLPHVISSATFEQMMQAGFAQYVQAQRAKSLLARDRALLWVLFDTGATVAEVCALRVADLDQQMGVLRIKGRGGKERQMPLNGTCLGALRAYLRQIGPAMKRGLERHQAGGDPLFSSQGKQSLTKNGMTMIFARFRKRAGIKESVITPQAFRHSFALRYLRAGGNPRGLQELLGYEGMAPVRQYLRWHKQVLQEQRQQAGECSVNKEADGPSVASQATTGDR